MNLFLHKLAKLSALCSTLLLLSCGQSEIEVQRGLEGQRGENGYNYASILEAVSVQDIAGDGVRIEIQASDSVLGLEYVVIPEITSIVVDNSKPECEIGDAVLSLETESGTVNFTYEIDTRYSMVLKSVSGASVGASVRSVGYKAYFSQLPVAFCESGEYELHAGATFKIIRLFRVL